MKKIVISLFMCVLMVSSLVASYAEFTISEIKVYLEGQKLELEDTNGQTVQPIVINGTTYLPVRSISESLGLNVEWEQSTKSIFLSKKTPSNETNTSHPTETVSRTDGKKNVGEWIEGYYDEDRKLGVKFRIKSVEIEKNPAYREDYSKSYPLEKNIKYRYKIVSEGIEYTNFIGSPVRGKVINNKNGESLVGHHVFVAGYFQDTSNMFRGNRTINEMNTITTYLYPHWDCNENEVDFVFSVINGHDSNNKVVTKDEIIVIPLQPELHKK